MLNKTRKDFVSVTLAGLVRTAVYGMVSVTTLVIPAKGSRLMTALSAENMHLKIPMGFAIALPIGRAKTVMSTLVLVQVHALDAKDLITQIDFHVWNTLL